MKGGLTPGSSYSGGSLGTVANYADDIVAPAILTGIVKDAAEKLIKEKLFPVGLPLLIIKIDSLIG